MKRKIAALALGLAALGTWCGASAVEVISERGGPIESPSAAPDKHKIEVVEGGIERNWKTQPPLIPHEIEKYRITITANGCLKCHSEATYKEEKAKRTPDSHFVDRDGKKLDHLSPRRWFCTQCHAPQVMDAPPIANTFEGAGK